MNTGSTISTATTTTATWPPATLAINTNELIDECELMEIYPERGAGKALLPVRAVMFVVGRCLEWVRKSNLAWLTPLFTPSLFISRCPPISLRSSKLQLCCMLDNMSMLDMFGGDGKQTLIVLQQIVPSNLHY